MSTGIRNDEPASKDTLDRDKMARALAAAVRVCGTPLVVGVYGSWGTGKTSLMRLVQDELRKEPDYYTVWFDSWQHQFDDNPAIGLLHTMVTQLGLGEDEDAQELLTAVAGAFTDLTQWVQPLVDSTLQLDELRERFLKERFAAREQQILLRDHLIKLLAKATKGGKIRLTFFIDDLDRCLPEYILKTLEALKLFLNLPDCVFILGVDRDALESTIRTRYGDEGISEHYLDKIVQVPFALPPITKAAATRFVRSMLPDELAGLTEHIVAGLDPNPRGLKRFVNSFILNNELAKQIFEGPAYDPKVLAYLLIVQYRLPAFYKEVVDSRQALIASGPDKTVNKISDVSVIKLAELVRRDTTALDGYIYLSEVVSVRRIAFDLVVTEVGEFRIQLIRVLREQLGLSLKDAKDLVETGVPITIATALSREKADGLLVKVRETGSTAEIV
ncbi:ribosomal protein L7/L12 [Actinokineospora diospyrosa]|uniref:Ribosomal protein L7/L12 C-terminal domain-containing protein n=1 Tax=Actinokineospora diospyrosa TaxID=103728 RepID=A0ABT1IL95_9PSEU|nr:ribosomal protein L7/L12 [Actinokineospora diospyrosa]MCP2273427.1 Ribosomal protein L7/L12 C-terminal domain-containing protein [Actinokineospora diospyrosa]